MNTNSKTNTTSNKVITAIVTLFSVILIFALSATQHFCLAVPICVSLATVLFLNSVFYQSKV